MTQKSTSPNLDPTYQETTLLAEVTSDPIQIVDKNNNEITYYRVAVNHYYTHPTTKENRVFVNKFTCEVRGDVASDMADKYVRIGDIVLVVGNIGIDTGNRNNNDNVTTPQLLLKVRIQKIIQTSDAD